MNTTVLGTIKNMLGIDATSTVFDEEIIVHINSSFMDIFQLMEIGEPKTLSSPNDTWNDVFGGLESKCTSIPKFIFLKTKLGFDPPSSSFVIEELKRQLNEEEWRLSIQLDTLNLEGGDTNDEQDSESE